MSDLFDLMHWCASHKASTPFTFQECWYVIASESRGKDVGPCELVELPDSLRSLVSAPDALDGGQE